MMTRGGDVALYPDITWVTGWLAEPVKVGIRICPTPIQYRTCRVDNVMQVVRSEVVW